MKGVVFTEFIEMMEDMFDPNMVDTVLGDPALQTGGAYTSVGTYDYKELFIIVGGLSKHTGVPTDEIILKYGRHLFKRFHQMMPDFFEKPKSAFEFLFCIEDYIHVEVRKLYPDAELPSLDSQQDGDNKMIMTYRSSRPMADFAEGFIRGCIDFYKEKISVTTQDQNTDISYCRVFTLIKE